MPGVPIVVLDEATSALDSESEDKVKAAIANLMQHKTVIAIAHRLSTIRQMDVIVVLKEGLEVERGTHDQLIAKKGGVYQRLWNIQTNAFGASGS